MTLYKQHIKNLQSSWEQVMQKTGFESIFVSAGCSSPYFLDDQAANFRLNPHFAHWMPDNDLQNSVLAIRAGKRPTLLLYRPDDYWHVNNPLADSVLDHFELEEFKDLAHLNKRLCNYLTTDSRSACIGEEGFANLEAGSNLSEPELNPQTLLDKLHYQRAYKSSYEVDCLKKASDKAFLGHMAAKSAFYAGASEFEIHLAYLLASGQVESDLPYGSIVALNEHGATLHYQHYDRSSKQKGLSFLIDAGARQLGYASDITRTYAMDTNGEFAALITALNQRQLELVSRVKPGINYYELHVQMHQLIADILVEFNIVNCTTEEAFNDEITDVFFPHGVGHFLGLQTHDVGGWLGASSQVSNDPPKRFPALRLTREVEAKQVFTIEPGIYFIPMLLEGFRKKPAASKINWSVVEKFTPYGGIRIEDNILVTDTGCDNLTRNAFANK